MKKTFFSRAAFSLFVWIVGISSVTAQIPTGYYNAAEGKTGAALKTALYGIINQHTVISYDSLWNKRFWPVTDCVPTNTTQIWDMYSNVVTYFSNHSSMEKEHCVPKSWWNETDLETSLGGYPTQYSDMFNLYPSYGVANETKSNYPLSEVDSATATYNNGSSKLGTSTFTGYTSTAFEPANKYKGDFARTYMYMATCYQSITTWQTYSYCMFESDTYPTLKTWAVNLLLKWSTNDTVSTKETTRNNKVYAIQGNRNPFIDHPEFADYIWGTKNGTAWYSTTSGIENANTEARPTLYSTVINTGSLQLVGDVSNYQYRIISLNGNVVKAGNLSDNILSISELPTGFYCLQLTGKSNSLVYKFLKNK